MGGVEPAKTFIEKLLLAGKSVVTANKELVSKHWPALEEAAKKGGAGLYFEASCVGGVPIIRALQEGLQANHITSIVGIINGTTNYILTKMTEEGMSYADALKEAQQLGYAEFNPTADVEGFDAAYKLSILASLAFHTCVPYQTIYREGITQISKADIKTGLELGYRVKLLAIGTRKDNVIEVRVHPTFVPASHPLAGVGGSFNAVFVHGDFVDDLMFYGRGAGARPTGSAIVSDVVYAAKASAPVYSSSKYYFAVSVKDVPGVLAAVTGVFARHSVSIESVSQRSSGSGAAIVFLTHTAYESDIKAAVAEIEDLDDTNKVESLIRVLA